MEINKNKLFLASCMALTVTSMTFAIRAGILTQLGKDYGLTDSELGLIAGMAFFGFPVATTLGGFFVDALGMKRFMWLAFGAHLAGLLMTVFAGGFWTLFISTFLIGFANGTVEAVCNPLVASMYTHNKVAMLNKFHVWFPGGIVIGALLSEFMTKTLNITGQMQVAIIIIPTLIYGFLFYGQNFPKTERVESGISTSNMFKAVLSPVFLLLAVCMFFTANTELSTTQWIDKLLGATGAAPLLILALVNGIMAAMRFFGEGLIHKIGSARLLLISAILATVGLYLLRTSDGNMLYVAAVVFALGVAFFWPTMLGFTSETVPQSGALGLSLMGGVGMLGNWAYQSFFLGPKLDAAKTAGLDELTSGRSVLEAINLLPILLVALFALLLYVTKQKTTVK